MMRAFVAIFLFGVVTMTWGASPAIPVAGSGTKTLGDMKLWFIITSDPEMLVRAWDDPKRQGEPPLNEPAYQEVDVPFALGLLFANCPAGPDGRCNVTVTYRILTPGGDLAVERQDVIVWRDAPPAKDKRELGHCLWKTNPEASDPPGKYVFQAVVTDHVNNKQGIMERTLELRAPQEK